MSHNSIKLYKDAIEVSETGSEAERCEQAVIKLLELRNRTDAALLFAFWQMYLNGYFLEVGDYRTLHEWARDRLEGYDTTYVVSLAYVVERVLSVVYQREKSEDPFVDASGQPITVERMLTTPGVVGKLRTMSYTFDLSEPENRKQIVSTIIGGTREECKQLRDEITGREKVVLPYIEEYEEGGITVIFRNLSDKQYKLLMSLIKRSGEPQLN